LRRISASVRFERPEDRPAIHRVHLESFPSPAEARLVDALRASGRLRISLVALDGPQIVGHVGFSPVTLAGAVDGLGLAPLAVLLSHRRHGLAAELIQTGLAACEQAGAGFVVVLGEPDYYARFGFRPASRWRLHDEFGGGDAFQALELRREAIPPGAGLVRFAPEFASFAIDPSA
jgi:putative acetyltransferase